MPWRRSQYLTALFLFVLFILIFILNQWVHKFVQESEKDHPKSLVLQDPQPKAPEASPLPREEIVRRTLLDANRKFFQSIFYAGDKEIGRMKSREEEIFDREGAVPEGKIKFINDTENTYGTEYWKDEERHGPYREFYKHGQLKREATYIHGKLTDSKVYYSDGILRMEEDYRDALNDVKDREVGIGKVYYRDGRLRYEWHLTNTGQGGYKKSYNSNGELLDARYFDKNGDLVNPSSPKP